MKHKDKDAKPEKLTKQKKSAFVAIEQQVDELHEIGEEIWRFNEAPGNEIKSHDLLCNFLRRKGFQVTPNFKGFQTAFRASFGDDEPGGDAHPNIGFLCVYDADEQLGHCHGHNLVTVVSLAAALALQAVIQFSNVKLGKITVVGCPGNATKTAKIEMHEAGCFKGIDFLITAYPSHFTNIQPLFKGAKNMRVTYHGRRSKPENEKPVDAANPVNACVLAYQNVSALRHHFLNDWVVKGVITDAGNKASLQPETGTMEYVQKTPVAKDMVTLYSRLLDCFTAAGTATGCRVDIQQTVDEFKVNINTPLFGKLYHDNAALNGFTFHNTIKDILDEDDISNVTNSIPTLKVFYYAGSPSAAKLGTDDFTSYVGSKDAQFMSVVQGKTLAMLAVDLMMNPEYMQTIFEQHQDALFYAGTESC